ncbi:thiamine phosphate synthase [bacterium]|nr:thiamine phosphate synthase [bacterium]
MEIDDVNIYVILDISLIEKFDKNPVDVMKSANDGGAKIFQLRYKGATEGEIYRIGAELAPVAKDLGAIFIINDSLSVAMALRSDGVHLGEDDLPIFAARKIAGNNFIIGASASSVEVAMQAEKEGASYIGYGAVFSTTTKKNTCPGSIDGLKQVMKAVNIPVFPLGGINADNADKIAKIGCRKVCIASGIIAQQNVKIETEKIIAILQD